MSTVNPLLLRRRQATAKLDAERAAELPAFIEHAGRMGADVTLKVYTAEQLEALLGAIGGHDDYNPTRASRLLGPMVRRCMAVTVVHDTSGPTLYFQIPYTWQQTIAADREGDVRGSERLTADERHQLAQEIIDIGRELLADEISTRQDRLSGDAAIVWGKVGDNPFEIRLWWD